MMIYRGAQDHKSKYGHQQSHMLTTQQDRNE